MSESWVENGKDPRTSHFQTTVREFWIPVALYKVMILENYSHKDEIYRIS